MEDNRQNLAGKKVVVGLTGRTDSALAAFLLKKQGMEVIGLSIVTVDENLVPDKSQLPICHIENLEHVKKLCENMGIPFYATNSKPRYESEVIDRIVSNKLTGMANSSCFYCSQTRMDILYEKMLSLGADFIATGHYAKTRMNLSSREFYIHSSGDDASDQSFLLAGTPNHILERLLLPLGDLSKKEIAKYAKHFSLPVDASVDQQGFCFRSKEASKMILESRVPKSFVRPGPVENLDTGNISGEHEGVIYHFITESDPKFKTSAHMDKKYEVVGYDYKRATLKIGTKDHLTFKGAQLTRAAFGAGLDKSSPFVCFVKFKYSKKFIKAELFFKNNESVFLQFREEIYPLIFGEVLVIYDSDSSNSKVLGWGLVSHRGEFQLLNRVERFESKEENAENPKNEYLRYFKF